MTTKPLSDAEKRLQHVLNDYPYQPPEVIRGWLVETVVALVNENLEPAMAAARAAALEEAAQHLDEDALEWEQTQPSDKRGPGITRGCATTVRALAAAPAPAVIPAERVREVLRSHYADGGVGARTRIEEMAQELDIQLDPTDCDLDGKGVPVLASTPRETATVENGLIPAPRLCECGHPFSPAHWTRSAACYVDGCPCVVFRPRVSPSSDTVSR